MKYVPLFSFHYKIHFKNFNRMDFAAKIEEHRHRRSGDGGPIISHDDFKFQFGICYYLGIPCTG